MTEARGPHHCIGVGNALTDVIFKYLNARCVAAGGTLSAAELRAAREHFQGNVDKGLAFFSAAHLRCMNASASAALSPFEPDTILGSLLHGCCHKAALLAFGLQTKRFGNAWARQFFRAFADFVRQHVQPEASQRLMLVYVAVAQRLGARLTMYDLLVEPDTQKVLHECLAPFANAENAATLSHRMSLFISQHIAAQRGVASPDLCKVTDQEMETFLHWLPRELSVSLNQHRLEPEHA